MFNWILLFLNFTECFTEFLFLSYKTYQLLQIITYILWRRVGRSPVSFFGLPSCVSQGIRIDNLQDTGIFLGSPRGLIGWLGACEPPISCKVRGLAGFPSRRAVRFLEITLAWEIMGQGSAKQDGRNSHGADTGWRNAACGRWVSDWGVCQLINQRINLLLCWYLFIEPSLVYFILKLSAFVNCWWLGRGQGPLPWLLVFFCIKVSFISYGKSCLSTPGLSGSRRLTSLWKVARGTTDKRRLDLSQQRQ